MKLGAVLQDNVVNLDVLSVDYVDQVWSVILVIDVLFVIPEQDHPPMVASAINFASSADFYVGAVVDLDEIPVPLCVSLSGPKLHIF